MCPKQYRKKPNGVFLRLPYRLSFANTTKFYKKSLPFFAVQKELVSGQTYKRALIIRKYYPFSPDTKCWCQRGPIRMFYPFFLPLSEEDASYKKKLTLFVRTKRIEQRRSIGINYPFRPDTKSWCQRRPIRGRWSFFFGFLVHHRLCTTNCKMAIYLQINIFFIKLISKGQIYLADSKAEEQLKTIILYYKSDEIISPFSKSRNS